MTNAVWFHLHVELRKQNKREHSLLSSSLGFLFFLRPCSSECKLLLLAPPFLSLAGMQGGQSLHIRMPSLTLSLYTCLKFIVNSVKLLEKCLALNPYCWGQVSFSALGTFAVSLEAAAMRCSFVSLFCIPPAFFSEMILAEV